MKYPKINTVWKRDKNTIIMEYRYSREEFDNIELWEVTEKVDGMNTRIIWNGKDTIFIGRTDKAIMPSELTEYLEKKFTSEKMLKLFNDSKEVILFGEGYGGKIQHGHKYTEKVKFILFDAYIDGWWLKRDGVEDISAYFNVRSVPDLGIMDKEEIIKYVKSKMYSQISKEELIMEGIVARSYPLMLFRDKKPIMFKLKIKDYIDLKKEEI